MSNQIEASIMLHLLTKSRFKTKRRIRKRKRKRRAIKKQVLLYTHYAKVFNILVKVPLVAATYISFYVKTKTIAKVLNIIDIISFLWLKENPILFIRKPLILKRYVPSIYAGWVHAIPNFIIMRRNKLWIILSRPKYMINFLFSITTILDYYAFKIFPKIDITAVESNLIQTPTTYLTVFNAKASRLAPPLTLFFQNLNDIESQLNLDKIMLIFYKLYLLNI